jgi:tetratricopeptide (TPR) repeat protein
MAEINTQLIEHYQLIYQRDPNSKVFAPLSEAYRKMGLKQEALNLCEQGVKIHPDFASGRVAYGRILMEMGDLENALKQLVWSVELSPENLLANTLLAETYLKLRKPKDALKAFKMVLFLNPKDDKARQAVKKLESLTADEYEPELFEMKGLSTLNFIDTTIEPLEESEQNKIPKLLMERYLSLADAFTVRGDIDKAMETLRAGIEDLGPLPDLEKRLTLLNTRHRGGEKDDEIGTPTEPPPQVRLDQDKKMKKVESLQNLLTALQKMKT